MLIEADKDLDADLTDAQSDRIIAIFVNYLSKNENFSTEEFYKYINNFCSARLSYNLRNRNG